MEKWAEGCRLCLNFKNLGIHNEINSSFMDLDLDGGTGFLYVSGHDQKQGLKVSFTIQAYLFLFNDCINFA